MLQIPIADASSPEALITQALALELGDESAFAGDRDPGSSLLRNTKIVCTLGPACEDPQTIRRLVLAGANVFRFNFSHADHAWHSRVLQIVRETSRELGRPVAVMQDLCGPKIRLTRITLDQPEVTPGQELRITTEAQLEQAAAEGEVGGDGYDLASNYAELVNDVQIGDAVLIAEGQTVVRVTEKHDGLLIGCVERGGTLSVGKGINLPGVALTVDSMTPKDWEDLEWGIQNDVDFIALSFVRGPGDLLHVHQRLDEAGSHARLIAKIERPEAIEHLEEIVATADGLMVARGDLGLETDLASVPVLQKQLIEQCRLAAKPVITATQMLESMVHHPTPTRAEVSDVANAIFDGTDAIMLSAETATGAFPEQAVMVLDRIAQATEAASCRHARNNTALPSGHSMASAIVGSATVAANNLGASRVVVYSQSGMTARLMSRSRLSMPIVAVTNVPTTYRQLCLSFGVCPVYMPDVVDLPQLLNEMDRLVLCQHWGDIGDVLVVVSALDGRDGNIDTLHIHRVQG